MTRGDKDDKQPDFLGVGAAKTGTSWLYACLREHPQAFVSQLKELDYFSTQYEKGESWYLEHFHGSGHARVAGELSPSYMVDDRVPARIRAFRADMKLIFIFRNPVERAYAHYCMMLRGGATSEDVDRELQPGVRLVDDGLYYQHLSRFLDHFHRKQLLLLFYDDLEEDPASFFSAVCRFLGIDESFQPSLLRQRYHQRKARPRFLRIYQILVATARIGAQRSRIANSLIERVRQRGLVDWFHRLNQGAPFPPLSDATRARLNDLYAEDVQKLSRFTDRDLSHWLSRS